MARQISMDGAAGDRTPKLGSGRRQFLHSLGLGAAGAAIFGTGALSSSEANAQAVTDAAILTFALNLEYLEAEFYLRAATGEGLPPQDIGHDPGPVTGGSKVDFMGNATIQAYATEIAQEEHRPAAAPNTPKPTSIMTHVAGSGTPTVIKPPGVVLYPYRTTSGPSVVTKP
jgi:hypothetical protein